MGLKSAVKTQFRQLSYKKVVSWYAGLVKPRPPEAPFNHIVQIGDPILRSKSEEIPPDKIKSPEINFLIERMKKVMKKYNCVGLAAPQIGINFRIFLMEFNQRHLDHYMKEERQSKEMTVVPFKVVINPQIKITDYTKVTFVENCESVRGFEAEVPRYRTLTLSAFDEGGHFYKTETTGWPARIIQHEIDHLDGKIYTDRMNPRTLSCSCWHVINERGGKVELPYGVH